MACVLEQSCRGIESQGAPTILAGFPQRMDLPRWTGMEPNIKTELESMTVDELNDWLARIPSEFCAKLV